MQKCFQANQGGDNWRSAWPSGRAALDIWLISVTKIATIGMEGIY